MRQRAKPHDDGRRRNARHRHILRCNYQRQGEIKATKQSANSNVKAKQAQKGQTQTLALHACNIINS